MWFNRPKRWLCRRGSPSQRCRRSFVVSGGTRLELGLVALRAQVSAFDAGLGDTRGNELDRANRIIVPGDRIGDMVGIAVAVDDRDDRNFQPGGLLNRDLLDS